MRSIARTSALMVALASSGCASTLRITNLAEPPPPAPWVEPRGKLYVRSSVATPASRPYVEAIMAGLRREGGWASIVPPWESGGPVGDADLIVDVGVVPRYRAKLTNFLVHYGGCFILAPFWIGNGYEVALETTLWLQEPGGTPRELRTAPRYSFRRASIGHGIVSTIGCAGAIAILPLFLTMGEGFWALRYDDDLTPEFVAAVSPAYGEHVARLIRIERSSALEGTGPPVAPADGDADGTQPEVPERAAVALAAASLPDVRPAPPRAQGPRTRVRSRWYGGFGLGPQTVDGWLRVDGATRSFGGYTGASNKAGILTVELGRTLTPRLLVGAELQNLWLYADLEAKDSPKIELYGLNGVVTWFPLGRGPFFRGGLGGAWLSVRAADGSAWRRSGVGALGGAGYAFWLGDSFNLSLNLELRHQEYPMGGSGARRSDSIGGWVGFAWY